MTVREARTRAVTSLREVSASPALDASLLLAFVLGQSHDSLIVNSDLKLPESALQSYLNLVSKRRDGRCVAYLTGHKEFRYLDFMVSPDVLVPRPETETLVDAALEWLDRRESKPARVIDLCTGSACVAISLKYERPLHKIYGADIAPQALAIARRNAERLLPKRPESEALSFFLSDLLVSVPGSFDLITANPPYIPTGEIDRLSPEVRDEPRLALDGGPDGLAIYRRLAPAAFSALTSGGALFVEVGDDQAREVSDLLSGSGFVSISVYMDLAGVSRVVGGIHP